MRLSVQTIFGLEACPLCTEPLGGHELHLMGTTPLYPAEVASDIRRHLEDPFGWWALCRLPTYKLSRGDELMVFWIRSHSHPEGDQRLVAIDVPGANFTAPLRINERGQISGSYLVGTVPRHRKLHGFIRRGERVLTLDNPAARLTSWSGITENGVLVGNQVTFGGFLAIPLPR